MRSDPTLKRIYNEFNAKWFNGELPKNIVVRWARNQAELHDECQSKQAAACADNETIVMDPKYRRFRWWAQLKETMLHEMCHVKHYHEPVKDPHRPDTKWFREMQRLARENAFYKLW